LAERVRPEVVWPDAPRSEGGMKLAVTPRGVFTESATDALYPLTGATLTETVLEGPPPLKTVTVFGFVVSVKSGAGAVTARVTLALWLVALTSVPTPLIVRV